MLPVKVRIFILKCRIYRRQWASFRNVNIKNKNKKNNFHCSFNPFFNDFLKQVTLRATSGSFCHIQKSPTLTLFRTLVPLVTQLIGRSPHHFLTFSTHSGSEHRPVYRFLSLVGNTVKTTWLRKKHPSCPASANRGRSMNTFQAAGRSLSHRPAPPFSLLPSTPPPIDSS